MTPTLSDASPLIKQPRCYSSTHKKAHVLESWAVSKQGLIKHKTVVLDTQQRLSLINSSFWTQDKTNRATNLVKMWLIKQTTTLTVTVHSILMIRTYLFEV